MGCRCCGANNVITFHSNVCLVIHAFRTAQSLAVFHYWVDPRRYQAKSRFGEFVDTFTGLVCAAQEFVRDFHGGERSAASLRDVARYARMKMIIPTLS